MPLVYVFCEIPFKMIVIKYDQERYINKRPTTTARNSYRFAVTKVINLNMTIIYDILFSVLYFQH